MELVPAVTRLELVRAPPTAKLEAIAAGFLSNYGNANTRAAYTRVLRRWVQFCSDHDVDALAAAGPHINLHARDLENAGRAPATVAHHLATIAGFYAYAVAAGHLPTSPAANVRRPRVSDESPTLGLDRPEMAALLVAAGASPALVDLALVRLLALNGLRVSEVCGADVGDLGTERGHHVLAIVRKGGTRAQAPLAPATRAAIDAHLAGRQLGPLLVARSGARLNRHQAATIVIRLARAAGIVKRISPHSLRHTFVTLSLDQGAKLRDVQSAAGHRDPATTVRYDRARHNLDRHPTYGLERFLSDGAGAA